MKKLKLDLTDEQLIAYIGQQESQEVFHFAAMEDRLLACFDSDGLQGDRLPWSKTHSSVALGRGELSLWAGINGHGKTQMVNQVMSTLAKHRNILIASMEMPPEQTLKAMVTQAAGCRPSKAFAAQWINETNGYIYDCLDKVPQERILGLTHYAGSELGIDHMVIDSLTMCGVGRDNYEGQAEFVDHLRCAAKRHGMHIHLVCHMRKGDKESSKVGKFDIRGAGEITDMADKVFIVQRNKTREVAKSKQDASLALSQAEQDAITQGYDTYLRLEKNRQDGTEAGFGLYFHKDSLQFVSEEGRAMQIAA